MASLVVDTTFWKSKKVLITGHSGFKGAWLSFWLQHLGADVVGLSKANLLESRFYSLVTKSNIKEINGDVRDRDLVLKTMEAVKPDIVFHLAAQPLVLASYDDPLTTFDTNITGTLNILNAVSKSDYRIALINVTSDKCYDNNEKQSSFSEDDKLGGKDPYSNSKACADLVSSSYMHLIDVNEKSDFIGISNVRAGNVLGGGDVSKDRIFPDILASADKNEEITIRNPRAVRPWQHVLDPLRGYIGLAQRLYNKPREYSQSWNFGPNSPERFSVSDLVQQAKTQIPLHCNMADSELSQLESNYLSINSAKVERELGWRANIGFADIVKLTIDWHRAANNQENLEDLCLEQIKHSIK